jgi:hypothetical protein
MEVEESEKSVGTNKYHLNEKLIHSDPNLQIQEDAAYDKEKVE